MNIVFTCFGYRIIYYLIRISALQFIIFYEQDTKYNNKCDIIKMSGHSSYQRRIPPIYSILFNLSKPCQLSEPVVFIRSPIGLSFNFLFERIRLFCFMNVLCCMWLGVCSCCLKRYIAGKGKRKFEFTKQRYDILCGI